jgi:hypothetical protein
MPPHHPGNKTEVRSVTFRCNRQDCRSTDVRRYGGCDLEEAEMWLASDPMEPNCRPPTKQPRRGWESLLGWSGRSAGHRFSLTPHVINKPLSLTRATRAALATQSANS